MNEPYRHKEQIGEATLYLGDSLEIMPTLEGCDHIITDPPFSERTHAGHDASVSGHLGAGKDAAERKRLDYDFFTPDDIREYVRLAVDASSGWIVTMTDHFLAMPLHAALEGLGRYVFAPLPYYAPGSRVRLSGDGPSSWTVWIVVARTSAQHRWGTLPGGYVRQQGWENGGKMGGKPVALMEEIIRDYSRIGDLVCDPFMGGAATGIACVRSGRRFIGIEIAEDDFDIACERIDKEVSQGRLFQPAPKPQQLRIEA